MLPNGVCVFTITKTAAFSLSPSSDLFSQKYKCVCLTAFPQLWQCDQKLFVRQVEKGGKKNNKGKYGCIVVGVFLELHLQIDNTHTHTLGKKQRQEPSRYDRVCNTFPSVYNIYYATSVPGYGTKIDVCFSTDTLSRIHSLALPFWTHKKWCNGLSLYRHFLLNRVWQIPTSYDIFVDTSDGV